MAGRVLTSSKVDAPVKSERNTHNPPVSSLTGFAPKVASVPKVGRLFQKSVSCLKSEALAQKVYVMEDVHTNTIEGF